MWLANPNLQRDYIQCCKEAVSDENIFSKFKADSRYNSIVGMADSEITKITEKRLSTDSELLYLKEIFGRNDRYGSPVLVNYPYFGLMSPSTIRYLNTLYEIKREFGEIDGWNVLEFGVGYGGLAFILNTFYNLKSYTPIDLPEPTDLTALYLKKLGIDTEIIKREPPEFIDLAISEFCFSEFDDRQMVEIYERYFKKAQNLYFMMNLHDETRKNTIKSLIAKDFQIKEYPEFPQTQWPNYVWICKKL